MEKLITKITDVFRAEGEKHYHPFTSAVILCAGSGSRFSPDGSVTKQNVLVGGIPVAVRTLMIFESCQIVDEIIAVCREDELDLFEKYRVEYGIEKLNVIVRGGKTRQESSLAGADAASEKAKFIMIHDAARCLVTSQMIEKTARVAYSDGAAIAAERCRDTVKVSSNAHVIESTADRENIWLAKTPQVFLANMYRAAAYTAKKDGAQVTDDASMAERLGFSVSLVDCGSQNLKITFPEDVILAEAIIASRNTGSADSEGEQ